MGKTIQIMIQLTEKVIAVEVPNDATDILLIHGNTRLAYFHPNYVRIDLSYKAEYLIGVTPLSEEQWKEVVDSKQIGQMTEPRWRDHQYGEFVLYGLKTATESGLSLIESKGLDINKKYAMIKIEK
ncbi:hypothetical protein DCPSUM001_33110 [Dysgonomonas capnocytophagoides]|nr:hypothetical protein DCPSUM001_33110 [Dysgonomonas capnocytophagoides]